MPLGWSTRCCASLAETARTRSVPGPVRSSTVRWNAPARPPGRPSPDRGPAPAPDREEGRPPRCRPNGMRRGSLEGRGWARWHGRRSSSSPACRCRRRAGGNGRTRRPRTRARRWCCAASARAACRRPSKRIGERLGGAKAGVAVDPRLFRLFGVERVPAVVVVPGGGPGRSPVPPCAEPGLRGATPAPAHDRIAGNIGLAAALEAVAGRRRRSAATSPGVICNGLRGEERPMTDAIRCCPAIASRSFGGPRGAGHARLLTWTAMFVLVCLMLWVGLRHGGAKRRRIRRRRRVSSAMPATAAARDDRAGFLQRGRRAGLCGHEPARAQHRREPPPGRGPGADSPIRTIRAASAGRAVVEGVTLSQSRKGERRRRAIRWCTRSETVAASPQLPVHGADGLASGSDADCGADLRRCAGTAGPAGRCGTASARAAKPSDRKPTPGSSRPRHVSTWRWNLAARSSIATTCASSRASAGPATSSCSGSPTAARTQVCS